MTDDLATRSPDPPSSDPVTPPNIRRPSDFVGSALVTNSTPRPSIHTPSDLRNGSLDHLFARSGYFTLPPPQFRQELKRYSGPQNKLYRRLPSSGWFADQPDNRHILVSWMNDVSVQRRLAGRTLILALNMMDLFWETPGGGRHDCRLVALTCLYLASKLLEQQRRQLNPEIIWQSFRGRVSIDDIFRMERLVFEALGYNAHRTTSYDYLVFYISIGFVTQSELATLAREDPTGALLERQELLLLQLHLELAKEASANVIAPDLKAAGLIGYTRRALGLSLWTPALTAQTGIAASELNDCVAIVTHLLDEDSAGPLVPILYNALTRQYLSQLDLWHLTLNGQRPDNRSLVSRRSSISGMHELESDSVDLDGLALPVRPKRSDSFRDMDPADDPAHDDNLDETQSQWRRPDLLNRKRVRL